MTLRLKLTLLFVLLLAGIGVVRVGLVIWGFTHTLDEHHVMLGELVLVEIGGWLGALVLAFAVGYFFAGRLLKPVSTMTAEVRALKPTDLHKRLPVAEPPLDEVAQLAATFNGLLERLESAFTAQRRFVADASHELKSPLTTVRGNLQLIRRHGATRPEEAAAWAEAALREVDRLTRMVNSLLLLARNDEGAVTTSRQPVDLAALAREVVRQHPEVKARAEGPAMVAGHADGLRQVLINLVDNALRATKEGGSVALEVAVEGGRVGLTVSDGGIGIPASAMPHLFDRFYRVDAARDRAAGGTGLGLAIVKEIVEQHQGTISVESEPGRGTTFTILLPHNAS